MVALHQKAELPPRFMAFWIVGEKEIFPFSLDGSFFFASIVLVANKSRTAGQKFNVVGRCGTGKSRVATEPTSSASTAKRESSRLPTAGWIRVLTA
jgi:hypothetical protein